MYDTPDRSAGVPTSNTIVDQQDLLRQFAERYIWWKSADEALMFPERVIAQVMNLGTIDDLRRLVTTFAAEDICRVIQHAEPGWFNERSWAFWHYRLGLISVKELPPSLPKRFLPDPD